MTHDPLCPLAPPTSDYEPYLAEAVSLLQQEAACQCDLIAKVRADQTARCIGRAELGLLGCLTTTRDRVIKSISRAMP